MLGQTETLPPEPVVRTFEDVVSPFMAVFFVAFLVAVVATPVFGMIARRLGVIDRPDAERKLHELPTAYLGGVAVCLAWLTGILISFGLKSMDGDYVAFPMSIVGGAVIVMLVGLWDDVRPMRPLYKLVGQAAAALVLISGGVGLRIVEGSVSAMKGGLGLDFVGTIPLPVMQVCSALIVLFFVIGACNSTNLLDGLDGLAGGVTGVVMLGFAFLSIFLAMGYYADSGPYSVGMDPVRIVCCLAILGALAGFLPYNFKPANIFMGDAGSMMLGYLSITMVLLLGEKGDPLLVMAGLTVFTLPILDTALAIVRRKARGLSIVTADSDHLHHLLMRGGLGVPQAVIALYGLAFGFVALGCAMMFIRLRFVAAVFLTIFTFITITAFKVAHRKYLREHFQPESDEEPMVNTETAIPEGQEPSSQSDPSLALNRRPEKRAPRPALASSSS